MKTNKQFYAAEIKVIRATSQMHYDWHDNLVDDIQRIQEITEQYRKENNLSEEGVPSAPLDDEDIILGIYDYNRCIAYANKCLEYIEKTAA